MNSSPSHYSIFDYWKDKCISEDGEVLIEYGYDGCNYEKLSSFDTIPVVYDWGEPACFCCNIGINISDIKNYEKNLNDNTETGLKNIWNNPNVRKNLQKCHIIPKSLNGSYSVDNMFLMCRRCHEDSPDTKYDKQFYRWVYKRRKEGTLWERVMKKSIDECKEQDIEPAFINPEDIKLDNTIDSHGGKIVESSYVATLVGSAEKRDKIIRSILECVKSL